MRGSPFFTCFLQPCGQASLRRQTPTLVKIELEIASLRAVCPRPLPYPIPSSMGPRRVRATIANTLRPPPVYIVAGGGGGGGGGGLVKGCSVLPVACVLGPSARLR